MKTQGHVTGVEPPPQQRLGLLGEMNVTTRPDGKFHWHIHLAERNGGLELLLPMTKSTLSLEPYRLEAPTLHPVSVRADAIV